MVEMGDAGLVAGTTHPFVKRVAEMGRSRGRQRPGPFERLAAQVDVLPMGAGMFDPDDANAELACRSF